MPPSTVPERGPEGPDGPAMRRIRDMIARRSGGQPISGAAHSLWRETGMSRKAARKVLRDPSRANVEQFRQLLDWLGWRIQLVQFAEPPPLPAPPPPLTKDERRLYRNEYNRRRRASKEKPVKLTVEQWRAWVAGHQAAEVPRR